MRAYGAKKVYGRGCITQRYLRGGKVHVIVQVKNRKRERALPIEIEYEPV